MSWHDHFIAPGRWYALRKRNKFHAATVIWVGAISGSIEVRIFDRLGASHELITWASEFAEEAREAMADASGIAAGCMSLDELRARFDVGEWNN